MPTDHIRYDILAQTALRGVVRTVLADTAKNGLPGDHHFKITFKTVAPGVRLSERMRGQYPEEMTIVLQHQFWDLAVADDAFEVGLSFGGIPERVAVPFAAVTAFYDPAAQFGFQFESLDAEAAAKSRAPAEIPAPSSGPTPRSPGRSPAQENVASPGAAPSDAGRRLRESRPEVEGTESKEAQPAAGSSPGGEVVPLDRFRKK
ncbi:MAG TPA: ClpXP protease specificity-enhancing factor SspB [Xanthobacteraceae bacterium]|jgi:hypothetical protein